MTHLKSKSILPTEVLKLCQIVNAIPTFRQYTSFVSKFEAALSHSQAFEDQQFMGFIEAGIKDDLRIMKSVQYLSCARATACNRYI